jgi:peptidoglycan/LPS O-acetylase OafA/YrhL
LHQTTDSLTLPTHRPSWLPTFIPELQGLRGLAVLSVVIFHCSPRLKGTWIYYPSLWGWAGVNLFFVLSGFLITSILLESREKPHFFRNFYGRRALRIWPVYLLVLAICYGNAPWFVGTPFVAAVQAAPWLAYFLFLQNLLHLTLPPALLPTWSLAIEEQYYVVWAPLVRFLRRPGWMAAVLTAAVVGSWAVRFSHFSWIRPANTLINLDGIVIGSLLALGLDTLHLSRRSWQVIGGCGLVAGISATATIAAGTGFLNLALATGFGGALLLAVSSTGARNPLSWLLRCGPLPFYGRISYGLYMLHIAVFIILGRFDLRMDHYGIAGDLAVIAMRLAASTLAATALWYGFESQILKLKRYF